jgi:hypothetical protein
VLLDFKFNGYSIKMKAMLIVLLIATAFAGTSYNAEEKSRSLRGVDNEFRKLSSEDSVSEASSVSEET